MIPNIGPRGQQRRLTLGLLALGLAAASAFILFTTGAPKPWRLGLFLPIWLGALGVFQAREKT
jgi:hypothetical protein